MGGSQSNSLPLTCGNLPLSQSLATMSTCGVSRGTLWTTDRIIPLEVIAAVTRMVEEL